MSDGFYRGFSRDIRATVEEDEKVEIKPLNSFLLVWESGSHNPTKLLGIVPNYTRVKDIKDNNLNMCVGKIDDFLRDYDENMNNWNEDDD